MKKQYDHYSVEEYPKQNGKWGGYKCSVVESGKKQGKLYIKSDGRENYQEKKKDEDNEYLDRMLPEVRIARAFRHMFLE